MLSAGKILGVAVLAPVVAIASSARADTVAFTAFFSGDEIAIQNDSVGAWIITAFSVTIGDTGFNYDASNGVFAVGSGTSVLVSPDGADDGVRSDLLSFTFTGFDPGERFDTDNDIDPDSGNAACCDAAGVLFDNGATQNANVSVTFQNLLYPDKFPEYEFLLLDSTLPECEGSSQCQASANFELLPEPGFLLLLGASAAALAARRRRSA